MITATHLRGLHVALATPLDATGDLDADGLDRLLTRVIDGGAHGVCPTGSTGEGPRLTRAMRLAVLQAVRARVPAALPVIPAPYALNASDVISEIADLATAGADAVLVAAPSYYPMAPDDVATFYNTIAGAAAAPIVIYNIPPMTKVSVPPSVVGDLATHPNVIGIKDSSRSFEYLQSVIYATNDADFAVLTGSDTMLLPSLIVGAAGTIAASANFVPQLGRRIIDAFAAGDLAEAEQAQSELYEVVMASRSEITPAGWKAALSIAGVCDARLAAPAHPLPDDQLGALATRLKEIGVV